MLDVLVLALAAVVIVAVGVGLTASWRRAEPIHPDRWCQEPAEPFGTIALAVFVCSPLALGLRWATGATALGAVLLLAVALVLGRRTGAIRGIREIAVTDSAIWVRTLRHTERVPLAHVLGIRRRGAACEVVIANGRAIPLPDGPAGERLAQTIEVRARRWRRAVVRT